MDAFELFQLGRTLMKIGARAMPDDEYSRLSPSTRAIVSDIFASPGSSISDITVRVRLPQSQVSACVARLREAGVVETIADHQDRRRTLVCPTPEALKRARSRRAAEIDQALAETIGSDQPGELDQVKEALTVLADMLGPHDTGSRGGRRPGHG